MPTFRSSSRSRAAQFARWNEVRRRTGYRSQFEADIAAALEGTGAAYESSRLPYSVTTTATYTPDWVLPDQCILIEAKGELGKADRDKMQLIRQQYPHLDIRFVLQTPNAKLTKTVTQADWCEKNGFPWCKGPGIPDGWLKHRPGVRSRRAFAAATGTTPHEQQKKRQKQ